MSNSTKIVYVLTHSYTIHEGDKNHEDMDTKDLFYSASRDNCEQRIANYVNLPGFRDYPNGFEVMEIHLDTQYWETGFIQY